MGRATTNSKQNGKKVTRYTYPEFRESSTPETGHTPLSPTDEQVVTLPMDSGWSTAIEVGKLTKGDPRPVLVDQTRPPIRCCSG